MLLLGKPQPKETAPLNLMGSIEIELLEVQHLKIHDSLYYQIAYKTKDSNQVQQMRINPEAFYTNPQAGDRVAVNMVMGNIMGASKIS